MDPDNEPEPRTYDEAVSHPTHGKQWEKSIQEEYDSIIKNNTWTLVPRPKDRRVVSCKWVFKNKKDEFGRITRLKSRLVARGFTQVYGVDYMDTFAPVAKLATIRALFAIAAVEDLEIDQMDVVAAFLASDLDEYLFMEQPKGFEQGKDGEDLVCLAQKSLYFVVMNEDKEGVAWRMQCRGSTVSCRSKGSNAMWELSTYNVVKHTMNDELGGNMTFVSITNQ